LHRLGDPRRPYDFDEAIRLNPDSSYFVNRGILKRDTKDFASALQDFDVVIEPAIPGTPKPCAKERTPTACGELDQSDRGLRRFLRLAPSRTRPERTIFLMPASGTRRRPCATLTARSG
jgi:hypothetical protein